uniref:Zona pellucida sperm-binding protein 3 n=1 Tax=Sphaeramia orbicularis TaxID=375764 RepID=A0A673B4I3_9TELE
MDHDLQRAFTWWMLLFFSLHTVSQSRFSYKPGAAHSPIQSRTHGGGLHPPVSTGKHPQPTQAPARPRPVLVKCHPDSMEVVVQADVFDTGLLVELTHLRLGSEAHGEGACRPVPSGHAEYTIWASLTDCGTKLSSTKEKIIYSNVLVYSPEPSSNGLLRLDGATIPVECHYERVYSVEGISLLPTWVPSVSRVTAEDKMDFSLRIMTADWQFERGSHTYFLGDPIHFEVSSIMGNHRPLCVFVDRCVATATPDTEATLRYNFIEPDGCLADAYLTNSSSRFLPRMEEHKLRFQIDAFKFYKNPSNQVYITCYMSAVPVVVNITSQKRACSFIENRWLSADGNNQDCRSCDLTYQVKKPPSTEPPKTTISIKPRPPVASKENLIPSRAEPPASFVRNWTAASSLHHIPNKQCQAQQTPPLAHISLIISKGEDFKNS